MAQSFGAEATQHCDIMRQGTNLETQRTAINGTLCTHCGHRSSQLTPWFLQSRNHTATLPHSHTTMQLYFVAIQIHHSTEPAPACMHTDQLLMWRCYCHNLFYLRCQRKPSSDTLHPFSPKRPRLIVLCPHLFSSHSAIYIVISDA